MNDEERVTYFGETDARNKRVRFGIKKKDRSRHMYVIGKTGMGKSTLLENLAVQDIQNGEGIAFIDPHGKTADLLLEYVPEHRIKDVVYFAPFDLDHPISFNVLEDVGVERRHLVVNGLMSAFKKIWVDAWSARMEYILTNILLALIEYPGSTLMGVNRMLTDKDFRKTIVDNVSDPSVKAFWVEEYAKYTDKFAAEAAPAIQNKVGQFVANPLVRNIIGQEKSSFDIRKMMDEKKILIINLSKGRVGEANANLLGAMLITKIYLAAMSRADLGEADLKKSPQFYLYVDEFQSFANESFADILSEARKYKLNLTIAHQYIEQMTDEVRAAVFGNVGTMAVFRVGAFDADVFQKEFAPQFTAEDLVNLQMYQLYLKLMIDGVTSAPFSANGMAPIPRPQQTYVQEIISSSRERFANPREAVENEIRRWHVEKIKPAGGAFTNAPSSNSEGSLRAGNTGNNFSNSSGNSERNYDRPERSDRGGDRSGDRGSDRNSERGGERNSDRGGDRAERGGDRGGVRGSERNSDHPPRENRDRQDQPRTDRSDRPSGDRPSSDRPRTDRLREDHPNRERDREDRGNRDNPRDLNRGVEPSRPQPTQEQRDQILTERQDVGEESFSLSQLKEKRENSEKSKNNAKDAKPQNVLALKEALLGLLGDEKPKLSEVKAPPEVPQVSQNEPQEGYSHNLQKPAPEAISGHGSHHHKKLVDISDNKSSVTEDNKSDSKKTPATDMKGEVDPAVLAKLFN